MLRYLKIILVMILSFWGLFSGLHNLFGWESGTATVGRALGMADTFGRPEDMWRATDSMLIIVAGYSLIFLSKLACSGLSGISAWRMWQARNASAAQFNEAKILALLGGGIAIAMLFGGFIVIGGEYYAMWQSEFGTGAQNHAFRLLGTIGIVLFFVNMPDD